MIIVLYWGFNVYSNRWRFWSLSLNVEKLVMSSIIYRLLNIYRK